MYKSLENLKFPFNTCENKYYINDKNSPQIYSFIVNMLIIFMLIYQLNKKSNFYVKLFF